MRSLGFLCLLGVILLTLQKATQKGRFSSKSEGLPFKFAYISQRSGSSALKGTILSPDT